MTGFLFTILMRVLKNDFLRYARSDDEEQGECRDSVCGLFSAFIDLFAQSLKLKKAGGNLFMATCSGSRCKYIAANIHTCNPEMPVIALPHDSSSPASTIFLPRFPDSARDFDTAGKNHDEIPFDRATTAIDQGGNISPRAGFQEVAAEMNLDEGTAQQMTDNQTKLKNLESLASSTSKTAPLTCNDLQIRPDVANKRNKWPTPRWNHKRHTPANHDSS